MQMTGFANILSTTVVQHTSQRKYDKNLCKNICAFVKVMKEFGISDGFTNRS